ncbi:MAG: hypothetical protein WCR36_09900 [Bacteroidaceae bacterium]
MVDNENIRLSSEVVDIAESKTYLELTSRICYYDDVNANNMMLPFDDTSEIRANTLVNMPVQARYKKNFKNEGTFGGHEMYKDANGNVIFNTASVGTHTEVYIKEDQVTTVKGEQKTLPCLFAKYRIWKRYTNVVEAVRRLFNLKKLFTSWEILTSAYEFKDGIKKITEYEFEANTLLGFEYATPSYGSSATALSLASVEENEMIMAEALSQDLLNESLNKETTEGGSEGLMSKVNKEVAENKDVTATENTDVTSEQKTVESAEDNTASVDKKDVSELTDYDLREKVREACKAKLDAWCYIAFLFPNSKEVWVEKEGRDAELDYVKFVYSVDENDVITVSEPEDVKLTVSIAEVNEKVVEFENSIASKDDSLVKASEEIATLKSEIAELAPYKEKFEIAEQEKIQAEQEEKKAKLVEMATKSGFITKEEIDTSEELKGFVDALDEKSLKAVIAEKFMASLDSKKTETTKDVAETSNHTPSTNLNSVEDEIDTKSIMKKFLGGKK